MTETLSWGIKEFFFTLTSVVSCEITCVCENNWEIKGVSLTTMVSVSECARSRQRSREKNNKNLAVRRFALDQRVKSVERSHVLNTH